FEGLAEIAPVRTPAFDFLEPGAAIAKTVALGAGDPRRLGEKGLGIADDADLDRIVAPNFVRVDVDLDEARRRDVVDIARNPRAGMEVVEAGADREDHIGTAGGFGGRILAPDAGDAEIEPVIGGKRALAHEGRIDGNFELFGERL